MDSIFGNQNNTGFVSLDEIENAFKTPTQRQDYYEPQPSSQPGNDDLGRLADPDGQAFSDFERLDDEPAPQVDHEHAMRTGERIARLIDTGIDFTLSNFVARNGESYRADESDLQDIAEAWGEVSEEHNWNISPEWTLAILYLMVYGPLVKQAVADRRMAELEARQQILEERMAAYEYQAPQPAEKPKSNGNKVRINPEYEPPKASPYTHRPAPEAPAQD